MNFSAALLLMRAGVAMRRRAWQADVNRYGSSIVFIAGAGTTRAVAVQRLAGAETIVTAALVTADDMRADDWERAT